jgi:hypothetical protein
MNTIPVNINKIYGPVIPSPTSGKKQRGQSQENKETHRVRAKGQQHG